MPTLTDAAWFNYDDIIKAWRDADSIDGKPYGIPYDGEVTVQVYRKDLYAAKGLKPADTYDQLVANAKALTDAAQPHLRPGAARLRRRRPEHVHLSVDLPRLRRQLGARQATSSSTRPRRCARSTGTSTRSRKYAPPAVRNWNWPDIADAFSQGTVASYIDAHSSAAVITNPEKSKVVGKIAYARWPKGPSGKRVTSIWNWGFPINAALPEKQKNATWLFIQLGHVGRDPGAHVVEVRRPGQALGHQPHVALEVARFAAAMKDAGDNFIPAALESLEHDTDVDWRPRVPQWPAIGETMATAIQAALVGQKKPKEALDEAQARIEQILKG